MVDFRQIAIAATVAILSAVFVILLIDSVYQGPKFYHLIAETGGETDKTSSQDKSGGYTIELREDGFYPESISIKSGETVTFITTRNQHFWPASDIHPSHSIYPEFDPGQAISPEKTWNFTFSKVGRWRYHDHISPYFKGDIIISETILEGKSLIEYCRKFYELNALDQLDEAKIRQCWEDLLRDAFVTGGLKKTFEMFRHFYNNDPRFVTTQCHLHAHAVGDIVYYEEYLKHKNFTKLELPIETVYCGYGFYHGLFEHLFQDEPDTKLAREICDYLDEQFTSIMPKIRLTCYHGIGHGFVAQPIKNSISWGDPNAVVAPAFKACDSTSNTSRELGECLEGAFMLLAQWTWSRSYGLSPNSKEPFEFCDSLPRFDHKRACYYEFSMHLGREVDDNNDIAKIAETFINDIEDDYLANVAINSVAGGVMPRLVGNDDHRRLIFICRDLEPRLREHCLRGVVGGFIQHGEPEREYIKAMQFCSLKELLESEREICYEILFANLRQFYTAQEIGKICSNIEVRYQRLCEV